MMKFTSVLGVQNSLFYIQAKILHLQSQNNGEVSEWSKEHAWKVCILQKGIEGSNPSLSALTYNSLLKH